MQFLPNALDSDNQKILVLKKDTLKKLPDFYNRLKWFQQYREKNSHSMKRNLYWT